MRAAHSGLRLSFLLLVAGCLVLPLPAAAERPHGAVIAWGCGDTDGHGQCDVPATATSDVTAIAASTWDSLALKRDGSVVAWGCRGDVDFGQCSVPAAALSEVRIAG